MLKSFIKIAGRNLLRNKGFSIMNILGLTIGMASAMLILLWVQNEWSYDSFYKKKDRLYQIWNTGESTEGISTSNITSKMIVPALKKDYPEIEAATRVFWDEAFLFSVGDRKLSATGNMVDPEFLTMFEFPFVKGNPLSALRDPGDVVISEALSSRLFGTEDPMGKTVKVDNRYNFKVNGVFKDLPGNTQFDFEYLLPWSHMQTTGQDDSCWGCGSTHNYVLLKPNASIDAVNTRISNIIIQHTDPETTTKPFLYPVSRLRLFSNFENGKPSGGKIETVKVFTLIAVLILFIACINFMNMSTARSERRAKEVGVRKVVGAGRRSLVGQFLAESVFLALISGILALCIVQLCLPTFSSIIGREMRINVPVVKEFSIRYNDPYFLLSFFGFILFTGVIAGSYPAFFLSSFRPVAVLKGTFRKVNALVAPRKVLVVLQFTFSIVLIIGTIIIQQQIKYSRERKTGYDQNNLIYVPLAGELSKNYDLIKNDLLRSHIAAGVSKTSAPITEGWSSGSADWEGKNPNDKTEFNYYNTDGDIAKTVGLHLVMGRDIDIKNYPTDSSAVIINEEAARIMGFKNPVGQTIDRDTEGGWHVIGVVRNFILQAPYDPIKPMVIRGPKATWFNVIHIKFNDAQTTQKNIADAEKVFKRYNPEFPFEYYFVDEKYAAKFSAEQVAATLIAFFAGLTIFISCLGLFGLAAYMAESRIREIGVRKVLGASVTGIATLLSKDFVKLVVIAIIFACPLAWWCMSRWLSNYSYRISISWMIFLEAGLLAIVIALVTISFQAVKAAIANPVRSLKAE